MAWQRRWDPGGLEGVEDQVLEVASRSLPVEYRVRLGALHLGPTSPCTLSVPLRRVLLLPDYSEDGARGDLALLQLRRPVPLSARVQPVCLPVPGDRPPPGTPCYVTGWGSLRPGGKAGGRGSEASGSPYLLLQLTGNPSPSLPQSRTQRGFSGTKSPLSQNSASPTDPGSPPSFQRFLLFPQCPSQSGRRYRE